MLAMVALMTACGSSSNETTTDSVTVTGNGIDSSNILPALTDSAKADSVGSATTDSTAHIPAQ
jgi:hypothetical protein